MKKIIFLLLFFSVIFVAVAIIVHSQNIKSFNKENFIDSARNYNFQIIRDKFGVPHIRGEKDVDAAFGFGFAQTEDDYQHVEFAVKMARGELSDFKFSLSSLGTVFSLIFGNGDIQKLTNHIEGVELDFLIKFMNVEESVRNSIETVPKSTMEYMKGYADGVNYWAALNPSKIDQSIFPVTEIDLLMGMVFQMPLFYGFDHNIDELMSLMSDNNEEMSSVNSLSDNVTVAKIKSHFKPSGSNAFAVSKSRSSNNQTMLVINSHQPLTGPVAWYEAHIKSNEGLNMMGGTFPGSPFIHVGFNENLGWGATVNQPDLGDIYELILNPENNNEYLIDGEWKAFKKIKQLFKIKLFGPFYVNYPMDMFFSDHGPVLKDENKAYALRYVGMSDIDQATAWYRLNKSTNLEEWKNALRMQEIASLNLLYADKEDNIFFVHNIKSPIRNPAYDWSKIIPGDDSSLIWDEFYSFDDIPQILNPNSGYLFSANQNPFFVSSKEDNLDSKNYSVTMGLQKRTTNRAYRLFELLDNDLSISYKEMDKYKHDNKYSYNSRQYKFLERIFNHDYTSNKEFFDAQNFLKDWDLSTDKNNLHAAFGVCILSPEWLAEIKRKPQPDPIEIFENCVQEFHSNFNGLEIKWSEVNFLERGSKLVPVQGGPDVLRAIYALKNEDGILKAVAGDGLYIYVLWDEKKIQKSESIHQFGSATIDPTSIHYDDQMLMYSSEKLKNTFFNFQDLISNTETIFSNE